MCQTHSHCLNEFPHTHTPLHHPLLGRGLSVASPCHLDRPVQHPNNHLAAQIAFSISVCSKILTKGLQTLGESAGTKTGVTFHKGLPTKTRGKEHRALTPPSSDTNAGSRTQTSAPPPPPRGHPLSHHPSSPGLLDGKRVYLMRIVLSGIPADPGQIPAL